MIGDSGVVTESITNFYKYFKDGIDELAGRLEKPTTYGGMMENFKEGGKYLTRSLIDAFEYVYLGITKTMSNIEKDKIRESVDINIGGFVDRVRGGDSGDNNIVGLVGRTRESNFGDYTVNNPLPVNLAKVENDVTVKIDPLTMNFEDLNVNHGGTIQLQGVGGVDLNNLTSTQLQELSSKLKTYMDPSNILGT
jgi:hypothetical protein